MTGTDRESTTGETDEQRRWREHYEYCPYAGHIWFLPEGALEVSEAGE